MDVVITGNYHKDTTKYTVHKSLRKGYKLLIGTECNDGRPITESWKYKQAVKLGIPIIRKTPIIGSETIKREQLLDKYKPKTIQDIIGHKEQINQLTNWLESWNKGIPETRGVLITGPPGIGKTSTVHLVAKSLGYKIAEYNASDSRSVSVLRGMIALGMKRLVKEIIVMDEIDGLSERGGIGEIASIIKKSITPIICISNEKPPKLRPIINICIDIKFNRPIKSTIANSLLKIVKNENIKITKIELEELCEQNGNDIRSILNNLEFYEEKIVQADNDKDHLLRMDIFSASQRLLSNKKLSLNDAMDLVYLDYNMVPLMVEEAYISTSKDVDEAEIASELLSNGDIMNQRLFSTQDWNLLPNYTANVVAITKSVSGRPPFQIFPSYLGKNSKRLKHQRWISDLSTKMNCSKTAMRLDYSSAMNTILSSSLQKDKPDISGLIKKMDTMNITRDDLIETLQEVSLEKIEIPTKVKTTFTREYNKLHKSTKKLTKDNKIDEEEDEEELENIEIDL